MSTATRLRAFKAREEAARDYTRAFNLAFGSARKPRHLEDIPVQDQGMKGSDLNNAYLALKAADTEWRNNIR